MADDLNDTEVYKRTKKAVAQRRRIDDSGDNNETSDDEAERCVETLGLTINNGRLLANRTPVCVPVVNASTIVHHI